MKVPPVSIAMRNLSNPSASQSQQYARFAQEWFEEMIGVPWQSVLGTTDLAGTDPMVEPGSTIDCQSVFALIYRLRGKHSDEAAFLLR